MRRIPAVKTSCLLLLVTRGDYSRRQRGGGSEPASGASHATDGKRLAGVTAGQVTDLAGSRPLRPGEAFPAPSSGSQSSLISAGRFAK